MSDMPETLEACVDWLCILQTEANDANLSIKDALEAVAEKFGKHKPDLAAAIKAKVHDEIEALRLKTQARLDVVEEVAKA
jgi:hypothetical protein